MAETGGKRELRHDPILPVERHTQWTDTIHAHRDQIIASAADLLNPFRPNDALALHFHRTPITDPSSLRRGKRVDNEETAQQTSMEGAVNGLRILRIIMRNGVGDRDSLLNTQSIYTIDTSPIALGRTGRRSVSELPDSRFKSLGPKTLLSERVIDTPEVAELLQLAHYVTYSLAQETSRSKKISEEALEIRRENVFAALVGFLQVSLEELLPAIHERVIGSAVSDRFLETQRLSLLLYVQNLFGEAGMHYIVDDIIRQKEIHLFGGL